MPRDHNFSAKLNGAEDGVVFTVGNGDATSVCDGVGVGVGCVVMLGVGVGVGVAVGLATGVGFGKTASFSPLFQTNLLPFLIQVNVFPAETCFLPALTQTAPALGGAAYE